jgi:hypothetical protein
MRFSTRASLRVIVLMMKFPSGVKQKNDPLRPSEKLCRAPAKNASGFSARYSAPQWKSRGRARE